LRLCLIFTNIKIKAFQNELKGFELVQI